MIKVNALEQLSTLTTISKNQLDRLTNKIELIIGHSAYNNMYENDKVVCIDIGIGQLVISTDDNIIKYKFIPSSSLEDTLKQAIVDMKDPLATKLEDELTEKLLKIYKDIF